MALYECIVNGFYCFLVLGSENNSLYLYYKGLSKQLLTFKFDTVRSVLVGLKFHIFYEIKYVNNVYLWRSSLALRRVYTMRQNRAVWSLVHTCEASATHPGSHAWNREASARKRENFLFLILAFASHVRTRLTLGLFVRHTTVACCRKKVEWFQLSCDSNATVACRTNKRE